MEANEKLEKEIDRYLNGLMTNDEKNAFDSRMAENADLQREVDLQRSIVRAVRKEQLEKIIQREEKSIRKRNIRRLVAPIGSLAIAASLAGFFYLGFLNNCEHIYDQFYQPYNLQSIPSRGDEKLVPTQSDSIFFQALHNMESDHIKIAIRQLEELNSSSSEMVAASGDDVKWYLALAYLKSGQKKKAKVLLQKIAESNFSDYKAKAAALLREI